MGSSLWRRVIAEALGSTFLAAIVIGSGIAAQRLSPDAPGLELLENAAATAAGLFAIILMLGAVSGAHFNPVVSLVDATLGGLRWWDALSYIPAQVAGCVGGALLANLMFSRAAISLSTKHRLSAGHWLGEVVATTGLMLVIFALVRSDRRHAVPAAVSAYIGAGYFFTSSTSFANPAITVGRMFSNSFAGIAPSSVGVYVSAQLVGGGLAVLLIKVLYPGFSPTITSRDSPVRTADVALQRISPLGNQTRLNVSFQARPRTIDHASTREEQMNQSEYRQLEAITVRLAGRYAGVFSRETVRKMVSDSFGTLSETATLTTYLPLFTERFARERLDSLSKLQGSTDSAVPEVLFVCVHNAGRSQMAAALLDHYAKGRVKVRSAGSMPASELNPAVIAVMDELGVDVSQEFPKPLTDEVAKASDVMVTMGCGDACPVYPGKRYLDWDLPDPAGKGVDEVRPIRDEIDARVKELLAEIVPGALDSAR